MSLIVYYKLCIIGTVSGISCDVFIEVMNLSTRGTFYSN